MLTAKLIAILSLILICYSMAYILASLMYGSYKITISCIGAALNIISVIFNIFVIYNNYIIVVFNIISILGFVKLIREYLREKNFEIWLKKFNKTK